MSDFAGLERRYSRLLAGHPRAFRLQHEQEILAVLMAGADEGHQRPRPGEAANLIKHALWMRLRLSRKGITINDRTFPISVDRPSRTLMTAFGAGRKGPRVTMSASTLDVRMGWAFHATIPRNAVASARPMNRGELRGPSRISVLRGVNYWPPTALVNGAGTGLVERAQASNAGTACNGRDGPRNELHDQLRPTEPGPPGSKCSETRWVGSGIGPCSEEDVASLLLTWSRAAAG